MTVSALKWDIGLRLWKSGGLEVVLHFILISNLLKQLMRNCSQVRMI